MHRTRRAVLTFVAALACSPAMAAQVSQSVAVPILPKPLQIGIGQVAADCAWSAGQVIFEPTVSGGTGGAVVWTMTVPSGNTDFVIDAGTGAISVGANGIAAADCGQTIPIAITATQ